MTVQQARHIAARIAVDAERIAADYEGRPFDGPTVASEIGETLALVAVLAKCVESLAKQVQQ